MEREATISVGGTSYEAEIATISGAHLGFEDRGIFTAYLTFEGAGWGQSESGRSWDGEGLKRYIKGILKTLGVDDWLEVTGKDVFVLRKSALGPILGIAHPIEDRYLIFSEAAEPKSSD